MFVAMGLIGHFTKANLSGIGALCTMGLIGLVIASLVNMFLKSSGFQMILSYLGVAIFLGLTAWDTQKLKIMASNLTQEEAESQDIKKFAIVGALQIYLDFINLFIYLLQIFSRNRN